MTQSPVRKAAAAQERNEETRSFVRRVKAATRQRTTGAAEWWTAFKPESTDGRREDSGRGMRKLQQRWSGHEFG